ncbi:MAG: AAC(3) family N-acetyltransferase [Oligoflexia bacterium]|nr:AAC(3) family N-acetyltransferase [Oligoflexia bacterium]
MINWLEKYSTITALEADILYIYSDFRSLGAHMDKFKSRDDFCESFVKPLLEKGKTIILTTFTYTTEGIFDVQNTKTNLGALNKWILNQSGVCRSEHPLFSFAALGPNARVVKNVSKSAFGTDSVHDRLKNKKAGFLHLGRPVSLGNTALHHVEHMCGATYRIHKAFKTQVMDQGKPIGTDYTAFLRRRDVSGETFEFEFTRAAALMHKAGLIKQVGNEEDLTNVSFYWYDQALDFLTDLFYSNQRIFIKTDFIGY